ncbi:hypothetical protein [Candidatus Nucleicultrix amoebiphila]|jgi:hypothetical protein|uniref:Uncharacterized protein n=1 Tax=Candidatus Nucleicultrix amoebiphila FS5 TaxID=1414854 RepID=A0A1W6N640_9PROT|nr:hypothetical protein [Candidatus Nucleicultrix amoebiphila]ARN85242.1 hypothetical protein GQ61_08025 [Candidatus Nucleicultrix amoebiphila FS5]
MKNINKLTFAFCLSLSISANAMFPENPEDHGDLLIDGYKHPGIGRITLMGQKRDTKETFLRSFSSAALVDALSLGLDAQFQGRVFVSARHAFSALDGLSNDPNRVNRTLLRHSLTFDQRTMVNDNYKPEEGKIFALFYPKNYDLKPSTQDDIVFGLLSTPITGVSPLPISSLSYEEAVGKPLKVVGYGTSGFKDAKVAFLDALKRAGHQISNSFGKIKDVFLSTKTKLHRQGEDAVVIPTNVNGQLIPTVIGLNKLHSKVQGTVLEGILNGKSLASFTKALKKELKTMDNVDGEFRTFRQWKGVDLPQPIGLIKAPKRTVRSDVGDSGGVSMVNEDGSWKILGVIASEVFEEGDPTTKNFKIIEGNKRMQEIGFDGYVRELAALEGPYFTRFIKNKILAVLREMNLKDPLLINTEHIHLSSKIKAFGDYITRPDVLTQGVHTY